MTQIVVDDGRLQKLTRKLETHPAFSHQYFKTAKEKIYAVIDGFLMEDYIIIHKDQLEDLIKDVLEKS